MWKMSDYIAEYINYALNLNNINKVLNPDAIRCKYFDYCYDNRKKSNYEDLAHFKILFTKIAKKYMESYKIDGTNFLHISIHKYGLENIIKYLAIEETEANKLRLGYELLK